MTSEVKHNELQLEYLDYYKYMVVELLSRDDGFLMPFEEFNSRPLKSHTEVNHDKSGNFTLFREGMVDGVCDSKRERLKGILTESISSLHQEVDMMLGSITSILLIKSAIKEHLGSPQCNERKKLSGSLPSQFSLDTLNTNTLESCSRQVYANFETLFRRGVQPKEALEMCSNEILEKLHYLEHFLDEYLDTSLIKCRPMSAAEKQQLGQKIHKLPMNAIDRVAEIIQNRKPLTNNSSNKIIHVNLDEEDDVTLWRLYCYVEAVAKAGGGERSSFK